MGRLGPITHQIALMSTVIAWLIGLPVGTTSAMRRNSLLDYDFKKVVNQSSLNDPGTVTWHTLRHTAASQWLLRDVDVFTVSRRLGHASAALTMDVYGHLLRGQRLQAADALDQLIAGA